MINKEILLKCFKIGCNNQKIEIFNKNKYWMFNNEKDQNFISIGCDCIDRNNCKLYKQINNL